MDSHASCAQSSFYQEHSRPDVVGIGSLLAGRLSRDQRRSAGIALALVGGRTTVPLVLNMISKSAQARAEIRSAA